MNETVKTKLKHVTVLLNWTHP